MQEKCIVSASKCTQNHWADPLGKLTVLTYPLLDLGGKGGDKGWWEGMRWEITPTTSMVIYKWAVFIDSADFFKGFLLFRDKPELCSDMFSTDDITCFITVLCTGWSPESFCHLDLFLILFCVLCPYFCFFFVSVFVFFLLVPCVRFNNK